MDPRNLPVYSQKDSILSILEKHQVVVVESPTGSGKTTQLPIILHEAGYDRAGVIGITQPRRIAAVSVCDYIQKQLEKEMGPAAANYAAYKMRFYDNTDLNTRIKVMTDGILLQEIKNDPELSKYSVIMIDEAHERSLNIDFILGLVKRTLTIRKDLKVIISSATINAEIFSEYFDNAAIVRIDTVTYPVSTIYNPPAVAGDPEMLVDSIVQIVGRIMDDKREGDVLIFLSGEKIIKDTVNALYSQSYRKKLHILPLYGRLSKEEQDEVFPPAPAGKKKIVVSTNIGETSITIDGISIVIDSGLAKMNFYNPRSYTSSLVEMAISKASANQRKGRAGRTGPGYCYRLYRREDFDRRPLYSQEEIYRTDLSEVVLRMAELGIRDFESFDFISSPGRAGIAGAIETLMLLDALNEDHSLSDIGRSMSRYPLSPRHSRMIVEAIYRYPDVLDEVITATSFLTTNSPYLLPQGEETEARNAHHQFNDAGGDFVSYIKMFRAFQDSSKKEGFCKKYYLDYQIMTEIVNIKEQLSDIVRESGVPVPKSGRPLKGEFLSQYICALSRGLIQFICVRSGRNSYQSLTAEQIDIHPGSVMFRESPDYIVAGEIVRTSRTFARSVSPIRREWLNQISPKLGQTLSGGKSKKKQKERPERRDRRKETPQRKIPKSGPVGDDGMQIMIAGNTYSLSRYKGKKKILILPWEELRNLSRMKHLDLIPQYQDLRVEILYRSFHFMKAERLGRALKIARSLNLEKDLVQKWPSNRKISPWSAPDELSGLLDFCGKLCPGPRRGKELGYITLRSDAQGTYWLASQSIFSDWITESLASLESLSDDISALEAVRKESGGENLPQGIPGLKEKAGRLYRRLHGLLEDI